MNRHRFLKISVAAGVSGASAATVLPAAAALAAEPPLTCRQALEDGSTRWANSPAALLGAQLREDPATAWTWQCNLAMMAADAGADRYEANRWAADFLKRAFAVDVTGLPEYQALMANAPSLTPLEKLKNCSAIASSPGNWDYSPYLHGMANGLALAVSIMEDAGHEPAYLNRPEKYREEIAREPSPVPGHRRRRTV